MPCLVCVCVCVFCRALFLSSMNTLAEFESVSSFVFCREGISDHILHTMPTPHTQRHTILSGWCVNVKHLSLRRDRGRVTRALVVCGYVFLWLGLSKFACHLFTLMMVERSLHHLSLFLTTHTYTHTHTATHNDKTRQAHIAYTQTIQQENERSAALEGPLHCKDE